MSTPRAKCPGAARGSYVRSRHVVGFLQLETQFRGPCQRGKSISLPPLVPDIMGGFGQFLD